MRKISKLVSSQRTLSQQDLNDLYDRLASKWAIKYERMKRSQKMDDEDLDF